MFCDLVGSTALSVRFDPEELREEIRAYQNAVSAVVARYDGFVAKYMGDEAAESGDHFGDGAVIPGDDLAQILGIEPRREFGRANQIAEHHRKLPALGCIGASWGR